ncbi:adenine nucleotide alpha hydrolases-like protein [Backusella circina FSU 941]|nr:adenine nucleotide alpha hydrolases-like protein [Backusella circina FSU 941]
MSRKILIGYDHSEISKKALEWIVEKKAVFPDDDITIATIVNDDAIEVEGAFGMESVITGSSGWLADSQGDRISQIEQESSEALNSAVAWFQSMGFDVTPRILSGNPEETLKDFAVANKIDLVIVGSRGLGFIKRQFLGSVSEYLTHHLKCSVLVVRNG